ncbi:hypothetical protein [Faecalicatena contorta]|nr:hypothetical protein [Faecalicatena contorta]MCF2555755.1 hypothetical protein [Faecalicatena contorta]
MKYLNKKTQAVIETACVISGGDWVAIESQPKKATEKPKKKTNKKSGE